MEQLYGVKHGLVVAVRILKETEAQVTVERCSATGYRALIRKGRDGILERPKNGVALHRTVDKALRAASLSLETALYNVRERAAALEVELGTVRALLAALTGG